MNVFDINEPGRKNAINQYERLGKHSFYYPAKNRFIHYFIKVELEGYLTSYRTIKSGCTYVLDLSHGEPHYQSTLELLTQKS